jgi:pimeloyl-ACP methyl ester carboxylesterase
LGQSFLLPDVAMAAKIPGTKKVVIANAGHASSIDQPKAFDDAVASFLDGLVA